MVTADFDVCVHCSARGCKEGRARHEADCPFVTSMWPVDAEMVRRHSECLACGERFTEGERYAEVRADWLPTTGVVNSIVAEWESMGDVTLSVCLPCAALGRPVNS